MKVNGIKPSLTDTLKNLDKFKENVKIRLSSDRSDTHFKNTLASYKLGLKLSDPFDKPLSELDESDDGISEDLHSETISVCTIERATSFDVTDDEIEEEVNKSGIGFLPTFTVSVDDTDNIETKENVPKVGLPDAVKITVENIQENDVTDCGPLLPTANALRGLKADLLSVGLGPRRSISRSGSLTPRPVSRVLSVLRSRNAMRGRDSQTRVTPLQRFKSYGKLALICVRLCKYSHQNVESAKDEYLSIIQVTEDFTTKLEDQEGIYFDPTIYRANKEERLPADARKILQKDPKYRTAKELNYLHIVLRSIKAFAEYPTKMQEQICKVAWYECYESKRAIVRQGQPPLAFYFILSGSVVVTTYDRRSGGTTFLVALHRGMSFGELAVINKSRRQATVSTATTTEFLCISASDFVEIFMAGGIKSVTDPENNPFIKSIPFLKHWPIECLAENPQACMFHFFGRGQVLVRDSNHSDWIYVVKSGSLSVLKKLVEVHPRAQRRNDADSDSEDGDGTMSPKTSFGTWNFRVKRNKYLQINSGEKEVFKNSIEADKRLEQTLPGYYNNQDRLGVIDYDYIINDHKSRVLNTGKRMSSVTDIPVLPKLSMAAPDQESIAETLDSTKDEEISETEDEKFVKLPKIRRTSKGAYLATTKSTRRKISRKEAIQEELFQKQLEYDKKLTEQNPTGRKTIVNELDNKPIKDLTLTEKDIRPMFVQVQVLERGQHFGLTKTVFPEQAESFSVVSNGAECIMISKKFFLEKATEATMHHLRQVETLLPPEEELQSNLQDFVDWRAHRARVYKRLVENKISRTVRQNQFPPSYGGQYSFRTGPTVRN